MERGADAPRKGLSGRLRPLSAVVTGVVRNTLESKHYALALLIQNWGDVVGEQLAVDSMPLKISLPFHPTDQGVLHIQARSSCALRIQHMQPQIIERVNLALGYPAVTKLHLIQKPLDQSYPNKSPATGCRPDFERYG